MALTQFIFEKILVWQVIGDQINLSLRKVQLGFEPGCDKLYRPVILKWLTILLSLPMWIFFLFMTFIRWTFLNAYAIAALAIIIISFFVDIIINTRNAIWDYLLAPIYDVVAIVW